MSQGQDCICSSSLVEKLLVYLHLHAYDRAVAHGWDVGPDTSSWGRGCELLCVIHALGSHLREAIAAYWS